MAHATFQGLVLPTPPRRPSISSVPASTRTQSFSTSRSRRSDPGPTDRYSYTPTCETSSTVWGPGALTGKFLKWVGEGGLWTAELIAIRTKLGKIERMQADLLGPGRRLTDEETRLIAKRCRQLVHLCILGMHYPPGLMRRGFMLILNGFKLPGRRIWTYYIAEAISERRSWEAFQIFQEGFFALLDDSVFRFYDFVVLETLCFRGPDVAHEIATIISYLSLKDLNPEPHTLRLISSNISTGEPADNEMPNFSQAIIKAGFFRLVTYWSECGMPHWDQRGIECLEDTLKDVADAQKYRGDLFFVSEAMELMLKLKGRRLLLDDVASDLVIEETE